MPVNIKVVAVNINVVAVNINFMTVNIKVVVNKCGSGVYCTFPISEWVVARVQ